MFLRTDVGVDAIVIREWAGGKVIWVLLALKSLVTKIVLKALTMVVCFLLFKQMAFEGEVHPS